ncbi:5'-AMP-activated_protein kinase [Hexamita inflata]|uniref:Beta subunit n=1 Tax=Hexamita inflata TaxID=28002 RepID=A0AA86TPZ0_9EUKA|nr:5'-AMP-activated protein kinase [Hexamita inflata]
MADLQLFDSSIIPQSIQTILTYIGPGLQVFVCGSFNKWIERIQMEKVENKWIAALDLAPGTHQFKFIVDSEWRCSDQYRTVSIDNQVNNVIEISGSTWDQLSSQYAQVDSLFSQTLVSDPSWSKKPPELPRALVKSPLNRDYQKSYSPYSLLNLPDSAVLNHFFKQKQKHVRVSASTTRYRTKYVTVVLYLTVDSEGHEEVPELAELFGSVF